MEQHYALTNEELLSELEWSTPSQRKSVLTFRAFKDSVNPPPAPLLLFGSISARECSLSINGRRYPGCDQTLLGRTASFFLEAPHTHLMQWAEQTRVLSKLLDRTSFPSIAEPFADSFVAKDGRVRFRWPLYSPKMTWDEPDPRLNCNHRSCARPHGQLVPSGHPAYHWPIREEDHPVLLKQRTALLTRPIPYVNRTGQHVHLFGPGRGIGKNCWVSFTLHAELDSPSYDDDEVQMGFISPELLRIQETS